MLNSFRKYKLSKQQGSTRFLKLSYQPFSLGRGVAAIVYLGPIAKFLRWIVYVHDFELYPFDRELFADFSFVIVRLVSVYLFPR